MSEEKKTGFEESLVQVSRVTRVTKGWRQLSFRAIMLVGNKSWKVWLWIGKSSDVVWAINKSIHDAYKNLVEVPIVGNDTVPYSITYKYKAAEIKLLPASAGTWVKAGSTVRLVLEMAGYHNMLSKIVWTNNKLNNAIATISALSKFKVNQEQLVKKVAEKWEDSKEGVSKEEEIKVNKDVVSQKKDDKSKETSKGSKSSTAKTKKATSTAKKTAAKTTSSKAGTSKKSDSSGSSKASSSKTTGSKAWTKTSSKTDSQKATTKTSKITTQKKDSSTTKKATTAKKTTGKTTSSKAGTSKKSTSKTTTKSTKKDDT